MSLKSDRLEIGLSLEGEKLLKIDDFTCSLMPITTEIIVIYMTMNGLTHTIFNFKKRKVMGDFNRNYLWLIVKGF